MRCPLCQIELPNHATQCVRCDWNAAVPALPSHRKDWIAAVLSFVPGLGHLYKGHLIPGALLLGFLGPLFLAIVFWLVPRTYGVSLLLPAIFVFLVGYRAYHLPDVRGPRVTDHALETLQAWQQRLRSSKNS